MYEVFLVLYFFYLIWELNGRPPAKALYLYLVMKDYQRAASLFGRCGIAVELAYRREIERVRLAS